MNFQPIAQTGFHACLSPLSILRGFFYTLFNADTLIQIFIVVWGWFGFVHDTGRCSNPTGLAFDWMRSRRAEQRRAEGIIQGLRIIVPCSHSITDAVRRIHGYPLARAGLCASASVGRLLGFYLVEPGSKVS